MRKLYFLLPGTKGKFGGGGLWAELKTVQLAQKIGDAAVVTYRQRESDKLFLADILAAVNPQEHLFVVSWGFDVPQLIFQLKNQAVIYHAHSADYGFKVPANIPIIAVSRNTMGYWGAQAANSLIYYLPNHLGTEFSDYGQTRDIDVLVQKRKSSSYLLKTLVPALQTRCKVKIVDGYVEDLAALFNRSKVYLYDSAEYWQVSGVTEGFGLPPLEAMACGCQVFASVNHALADYLDPGFNCHKIGCYSPQYDLEQILKVLNSPSKFNHSQSFWSQYQEENLMMRLQIILAEINDFFDRQAELKHSIRGLDFWFVQRLKIQRILQKIQKKLS